MAVIVYRKFGGEVPSVDPQLLPLEQAQYAENCEFTRGSLKPMKGGALLATMLSNPVKGIYTEDGINFYTWNQETYAFKSPVVDEVYNRIYYLTPAVGSFSVTTTTGMATNGPSPSLSFKSGVPRPTVAPTLALVSRTTLPDYPSATVTIDAWYELSGTVYDKVEGVAYTATTAFQRYTFANPAKTPWVEATTLTNGTKVAESGTPAEAVLKVKLNIFNGVTSLAGVTASEASSGRSAALPGGFEVKLSKSSTSGWSVIDIAWGVVETRAYTYLCRNTWDEEGAPAPAATISPNYIQNVTITVTPPDFTGYRPLKDYRIYRTYGTGATYIQTDVTGSAPTFTDASTSAATVGKALESANWTPPPDNLAGLVLMPNGWFAAFKGNTLYMSEPYRPHAWPYSMSFGKNIRGIAAAQQSIVVTTADGVHVVSGAFPAAAQSIMLNLPQAGVAQRSMTTIDGAVAYATNDGFALVSGAQASMDASQRLFTRQTWRDQWASALTDASLRLGYHDGCLVGTSSTQGKGFSLRFDEDSGNYSRITGGYDAMFYLPVADTLYYAVGTNVYRFKDGSPTSMDWWGKDFVYPSHTTFGAGYLRSSGSVTLRLYADGVMVHQQTISPGHFRLPSLRRALRWSVRISGSNEIIELLLARTMMELKSV